MTLGVILTYDKNPIIVRDIDVSLPSHTLFGEEFVVQDNVSDFLYDWLKDRDGVIVGVRFFHINDGGYDHILGRRNVIDHRDEDAFAFTIFFGPQREYHEPKEHDYRDFGCRELYIGSKGSTMFTFYLKPNERILGE